MFQRFPNISGKAAKDLTEYISLFWSKDKTKNKILENCFGSAHTLDEAFWDDETIIENIPEFISKLLHWLEQRRINEDRPWTKQGRKLQLFNPDICKFLKYYENYCLDRLIIGDKHYLSGDDNLSYLLLQFAEEAVKNADNLKDLNDKIMGQAMPVESIKIEFNRASKKQLKNFGNFASRLHVSRKIDDASKVTLQITYNEKIISEKTGSKKAYESAFLHEIGHARIQLDWYLKEIAEGIDFIDSRPSHEYEAWVYCQAIQCLIKSLRSRITRLLRDEDKEWIVS